MVLDEASRLRILTAPGGAFPLTELVADGVRLQMFDRDPRTMRDAFLATATHGDRLAVVYGDERWTYAEQWDEVVALAHALRDDLGVEKGDHIGIVMRNYPEFIFSFWAAQLVGAVVVPFNAWLKTRELSELIAQSRPKVLFADRERIALLAGEDLSARGVSSLVAVRTDGVAEDAFAFSDLVTRKGEVTAPPPCDIEPEEPSTILFTSGTTGLPKGARHSHRNHSASLLNKLIRAVRVIPSTESSPLEVLPPAPSVKLVTFPFFHIAGMNTLYTAAYSGHTVVLMYKWDADEALRLIETEGVSELAGPPFVIQTFLAAAADMSRNLSSLRVIGMGGSAAPVRVIHEIAERFGSQVTPRSGYGMTETTSGVVSISAAEFQAHPDSVGRPLPTAEVAILGEDGTPVDAGCEGEIAIRGPQVVRGYYDSDESVEFRDGWFHTGDLGRIDENGLIYIVGRLKDIVIRGGENINCSEVEAVLTAHHDVIEAAVFGVPHATLGEELVAIVRVDEESALDAGDLRAFVAERLAAFKVPARIALTHVPLPRTPSGKIIKRDIAETVQVTELLEPVINA